MQTSVLTCGSEGQWWDMGAESADLGSQHLSSGGFSGQVMARQQGLNLYHGLRSVESVLQRNVQWSISLRTFPREVPWTALSPASPAVHNSLGPKNKTKRNPSNPFFLRASPPPIVIAVSTIARKSLSTHCQAPECLYGVVYTHTLLPISYAVLGGSCQACHAGVGCQSHSSAVNPSPPSCSP